MKLMFRRMRVIVSGLVVAGIFASGVATCTAGAMMPEIAQMACCKAGHHTCGKDGAPADCCKKHSSPEPQYNTVAKTDSLKAPARLFLALVTVANPLSHVAVLVQAPRSLGASPPDKLLGPPVYILLSTLLI
jgi:hypothetical protein